MTTDLEKLSTALKRDTPEKLVGEAIERHKAEIEEALKAGRDYVLDEGHHQFVIKRAG